MAKISSETTKSRIVFPPESNMNLNTTVVKQFDYRSR